MGVFFYNIFLLLFRLGTHLVSPLHPKAKKWVRGRKQLFKKLEEAIPKGEKITWVHCASLGEFEQGRPVMEKLKLHYPSTRILLTFFSPSGYEVRKDYPGADWVFYLPMDGPRNAKRFLEIVRPSLVIFVKYEFWYYYLKKIKYRGIPLLLISAIFRKEMSFFAWYGAIQRKILSRFDHLFVQNEDSKKLLDAIGLGSICTVSGDTRFDRVIEIADGFRPLPLIEDFAGNSRVIVAGSTWPADEEALQKAWAGLNDPFLKLIIAPHEIDDKHLQSIRSLFPGAAFYSQWPVTSEKRPSVLVIDNIGMLSRLYRYAHIAYVGGGLSPKGVHNVLEAAVYHKIVLFGPYYEKYSEALGLVRAGGGLSFHDDKKDGQMLRQLIEALLKDKDEYDYRCRAAGEFVRSQQGASDKILRFIQEKRLLTS